MFFLIILTNLLFLFIGYIIGMSRLFSIQRNTLIIYKNKKFYDKIKIFYKTLKRMNITIKLIEEEEKNFFN
jgi:hypothetical protein